MSRKVFIILLGFAACTAMVTVFGENGILRVLALRGYSSGLEETVSNIRRENQQLARHIRDLKNDPRIVEKIAREKLGMAKKGDVIYFFKTPNPQN